MDNQQQDQQTMQPAGQPAMSTDPMAAMPATPSMPTPDAGASMAPGGMPPAPVDPMATPAMSAPVADPMATSMSSMPASSGMDAMASSGMTAPVADPMVASMPAAPVDPMAAPASAGPATLEDVMAELRKIEDKLVEMDEKL